MIDGYKIQFYSADQHEPPHVHIVKAEKRAKIWLYDLSISWNRHFSPRELRQVMEIVRQRREELIEWYHGFFA